METAKITKTRVDTKTKQATITVRCPYCGKTHQHGIGKIPETVIEKELLKEGTAKMSHCLQDCKLYLVKINE